MRRGSRGPPVAAPGGLPRATPHSAKRRPAENGSSVIGASRATRPSLQLALVATVSLRELERNRLSTSLRETRRVDGRVSGRECGPPSRDRPSTSVRTGRSDSSGPGDHFWDTRPTHPSTMHGASLPLVAFRAICEGGRALARTHLENFFLWPLPSASRPCWSYCLHGAGASRFLSAEESAQSALAMLHRTNLWRTEPGIIRREAP